MVASALAWAWSIPPTNVTLSGGVTEVRSGYMMHFSEDPLVDTCTVAWDSAAFKTWYNAGSTGDSLTKLVFKGTRVRAATVYTTNIFPTAATTHLLFALTGSTSLDSVRFKATVVRGDSASFTVFEGRHRGDHQGTWKTLDTTAVVVLARSNTFTGPTQTVYGSVPIWRLIQTSLIPEVKDTSKWWIDATDTARHYSNVPVVWSGAYRRFLNTTKFDSADGTVIKTVRSRINPGATDTGLVITVPGATNVAMDLYDGTNHASITAAGGVVTRNLNTTVWTRKTQGTNIVFTSAAVAVREALHNAIPVGGNVYLGAICAASDTLIVDAIEVITGDSMSATGGTNTTVISWSVGTDSNATGGGTPSVAEVTLIAAGTINGAPYTANQITTHSQYGSDILPSPGNIAPKLYIGATKAWLNWGGTPNAEGAAVLKARCVKVFARWAGAGPAPNN